MAVEGTTIPELILGHERVFTAEAVTAGPEGVDVTLPHTSHSDAYHVSVEIEHDADPDASPAGEFSISSRTRDGFRLHNTGASGRTVRLLILNLSA